MCENYNKKHIMLIIEGANCTFALKIRDGLHLRQMMQKKKEILQQILKNKYERSCQDHLFFNAESVEGK